MLTAHILTLVLAMLLLAWIGWRDFLTFRIANRDVIILTVVALAAVALDPSGGWKGSLIVGGVLFVLGFGLWALGMIGAGDAKLYLPLGLLIGWQGIGVYAVVLLALSVLMVIGIRMAGRGDPDRPRGLIGQRLALIAEQRKMPYGVPMALAAIVAILTGL